MPTALVTGTSTGIGTACVARLAASGWTVYAGVRRRDDGTRLRTTYGERVHPVVLDVTDAPARAAVLRELAAAVGDTGLQGLVNNAGIGVGGPVEHVADADWRAVFDTNLFGVVSLTRDAMPLLRVGRGRVVHIGSISGRIAAPGVAPYAASKHALEALAESMRQELALARDPVQVALVEPGRVRSAIWDKTSDLVDGIEAGLDGDASARYAYLVDLGRGFVEEGRTKSVDAARVAEAVLHALTATRPRARYLVGPDARFAGHVVARLPDRLRDALTRAEARRMVRVGRRRRAG